VLRFAALTSGQSLLISAFEKFTAKRRRAISGSCASSGPKTSLGQRTPSPPSNRVTAAELVLQRQLDPQFSANLRPKLRVAVHPVSLFVGGLLEEPTFQPSSPKGPVFDGPSMLVRMSSVASVEKQRSRLGARRRIGRTRLHSLECSECGGNGYFVVFPPKVFGPGAGCERHFAYVSR